ncbi:hypothetical protein MSG28_012243 [Choristoneura fumiferana]|uniref:Uncharacterized protein n=1 Tax=Choristoneura fumiferana TaxID=7141 RepID=A0ACC0KCE0_CHOFU|nr:hypothetical protein MSG28_012243 [Choristoneura fumiferana]
MGVFKWLRRIFNGECSDELFDLIPAAMFHHRSTRHKGGFHPHHLDDWCSSTVRNLAKKDSMQFNVHNYAIASAFCRESAAGGGSLILVKNGLKFKERKDLSSLSVERVCEIASAETEQHYGILTQPAPLCLKKKGSLRMFVKVNSSVPDLRDWSYAHLNFHEES